MNAAEWIAKQRPWVDRAMETWSARPGRAVPARVRLWFSSGITWDGYTPVMLDSVLQYFVVALCAGMQPDDVFADAPRDAVVRVPSPIATMQVGNWEIPRASVLIPSPFAVETVRFQRKRTRAEALGLDKIMINGGPYKALNTPVPTLTTPWADTYVVADLERLNALLPYVFSVARNHAGGFGTVFGFKVTETREDESVRTSSGWLRRPLPMLVDGSELDMRTFVPESYEERHAGLCGPYWLFRNRDMAIVPTLGLRELARAA